MSPEFLQLRKKKDKQTAKFHEYMKPGHKTRIPPSPWLKINRPAAKHREHPETGLDNKIKLRNTTGKRATNPEFRQLHDKNKPPNFETRIPETRNTTKINHQTTKHREHLEMVSGQEFFYSTIKN